MNIIVKEYRLVNLNLIDMHLAHCSMGYKMAAMKNPSATTLKSLFFAKSFKKGIVLEANRLEPRSGGP